MSSFSRREILTTGLAAGATTLLAAPAIAATQPYQIPDHHRARMVKTRASFNPGDVHVDPGQFALYLILPDQQAIRYPVGIGKEDRYVSGTFRVGAKREWPSWTPTKNMIRREPHLYAKHAGGMKGGPDNPLGARAIYLYSGGRDSYLRIHGTPNPTLVGQRVSNGCVRMINVHVQHLYERVPKGTRVILH